MNSDRIRTLLDRYMEGETSSEEEAELRAAMQREDLPEALRPEKALFDYCREARERKPAPGFDPFGRLPAEAEQDTSAAGTGFYRRSLRIAAGIILLLTGFAGGLLLDRQSAGSEEVAALQQEVDRMKQVLIEGHRQQSSASERISMINTSAGLTNDGEIGLDMQDILIYTMNNDPSVNVRIAAAEALFRYRDRPRVREAMIRSLPRQNEPVMQITMIRLLVEMSEKGAISEMQKMLVNTETREVVRPMLENGIAELRTI